jgi:hypothetical protein
MLPPTSSTGVRPRRPLTPLVEDAPPPRRPAPSRRQPPPKRSGSGKWIALLFVVVVIVAGVIAYQAVNSGGNKQVQLNEDVGGNVDDALQSFKDLVSENTR